MVTPDFFAIDPTIHLDYRDVSHLLSDVQRYILRQPHATLNVPAVITLNNRYQVMRYTLPDQHLPHPKTGTLLRTFDDGSMLIAGRLGITVHTHFKSQITASLHLFETINESPTQDYADTLAETFLLSRLDYDMPRALMENIAGQLDADDAQCLRMGHHRLHGTLVIMRDTHRVLDFIPRADEQDGYSVQDTRLLALDNHHLWVDAITNGHEIHINKMLVRARPHSPG
jgi:hypothetical protein